MGRRSRKRLGAGDAARDRAPAATGSPTSHAAPRRRARLDEAPAAPGAPFPRVELCLLHGIVMIVAGFLTEGQRGRVVLGCGLALVTLSSLELSIREHFAGYRSHSALLAGAAMLVTMVPLFFLTGLPQEALLILGLAVFGVGWTALRRVFIRRSGGFGFRV